MNKINLSIIFFLAFVILVSCNENKIDKTAIANVIPADTTSLISVDTSLIPHDKFGDAVRYGRQLMLHTAYYIGPDGINGKYLGNKMNCTNCHQDAGTKLFSFNLLSAHETYPQYRAREGKVLTLAERVNNCVMRPHNGKPLPLDSKEMIAFLSYLKWINSYAPKTKSFKGAKNLEVEFPSIAASSQRGSVLFSQDCARCHGGNGEGLMDSGKKTFIYPLYGGQVATSRDQACIGLSNRLNG